MLNKGYNELNKTRPGLLEAHNICLMLENARNTCLLEAHKSSYGSDTNNSSVVLLFKNSFLS